jgi:hypothetical protein
MGKAKGKLKVKKLTKEKDEEKPLGKRKVVWKSHKGRPKNINKWTIMM